MSSSGLAVQNAAPSATPRAGGTPAARPTAKLRRRRTDSGAAWPGQRCGAVRAAVMSSGGGAYPEPDEATTATSPGSPVDLNRALLAAPPSVVTTEDGALEMLQPLYKDAAGFEPSVPASVACSYGELRRAEGDEEGLLREGKQPLASRGPLDIRRTFGEIAALAAPALGCVLADPVRFACAAPP